jgi:hypothetical protein
VHQTQTVVVTCKQKRPNGAFHRRVRESTHFVSIFTALLFRLRLP